MASEFGKDELLAQAILDLELKMKHEIRQNNAYLLSKIEKHYEQTNQKLIFLEAKMEAMCREREHHSHSRGGRRTNFFATNNFVQNNPVGGRAYGVDGRRQYGPMPPPNTPNYPQQQHPYKVFGVGGSGASAAAAGGGGGGGNAAGKNRQQQYKQNTEKPPIGGDGHGHGGRYKQTLGTSKAQVLSPSMIQNQWTTKAAGIYSDDEASSDGSECESQKSDLNALLTTAPPNELGEDQAQKDGDNEQKEQPPPPSATEAQTVEEETDETGAVEVVKDNGEKVVVQKLEETQEEITAAGSSGDSQAKPLTTVETRKENTDNKSFTTSACTAAVAMMLNINENHPSMSTVTPGATISPVIGGFGRRRK